MAIINKAIQRAADLLGGQSELARQLSALGAPGDTITPQGVSYWCRSGRLPAERVLDVERLTQGRVSRHDLRPDLYPVSIPDYLAA